MSLYVSRKELGRGLANIEDSADASTQNLEITLKMPEKTDYCDQKQYKQHKHEQNQNNMKQKMGEKKLCGYFKR